MDEDGAVSAMFYCQTNPHWPTPNQVLEVSIVMGVANNDGLETAMSEEKVFPHLARSISRVVSLAPQIWVPNH